MCQCAKLGSGTYREYELPDGARAAFVDHAGIADHWEYVERCTDCGALWHKDTICGHANVDTYRQISQAECARLLAGQG
jgi:hypothetical protein